MPTDPMTALFGVSQPGVFVHAMEARRRRDRRAAEERRGRAEAASRGPAGPLPPDRASRAPLRTAAGTLGALALVWIAVALA